ncbi:MAG: TIR domain-containing protein [Clostridiales bacterium]|nr:TIR domain-containing protein [Clostridiales bacterium]
MAKNWEYGFAIEHHVPILPITVESGLEEYFAVEMNRICDGYGDIQLLRMEVTDRTEIPYYQKLGRDLGAILLENKEIERIKQAFSGKIFLSYRKKERIYANELMHTIHSIPSLRNVSIWFDEFMSSGERWSDQIDDALKQSDVFLLMVSPSITEPDNYIIREEYPAALKQDKKIVSVEKSENKSEIPDIEELRQLFPGLSVFVDGDDTDGLENMLQEISSAAELTPETDYLIGLAFLNGIEMEHDTERAVSLIVASARQNFPEAIRKLAEMYWKGDGIGVNYENSILWRKRLVELYEHKVDEIKEPEETLKYIRALEGLATSLYELSSFRESLLYAKQLVKLMEQIASFSDYRSLAYDLCGKNCKRLGLYDDAIAYADKFRELAEEQYKRDPSTNNRHNISVACERVGDAYYAIGDFEQTESWYLKAIEIDRRIDEELKSIDSAFTLSVSTLMLGDIYIRHGEYEKAEQIYDEAVQLRKRILEAENTDDHRKQYGEVLLVRGTALLLKRETDEARKNFSEAKEIFRNLAEKHGTIEIQYSYSISLNRCGRICEEKRDFASARECYIESLEIRRKILKKHRSMETLYEYALVLLFKARASQHVYDWISAKADYEEIVEKLRPVLAKDRKGDCHRIFTEAAFERFKIDTYSGKHYLQYAIDGWKWLLDRSPSNRGYQKQYDLCQKMYWRCYSD